MPKYLPTFVELANDGVAFPLTPPFELEKIPIPIDILDSLVARYLPGHVPGWVEFTRQEITPVNIRYYLHLPDFGHLGKIDLFKTGDQESAMDVSTPPLSSLPEDTKKIASRHSSEIIQALFASLAVDTTWKDHWCRAGQVWESNSNPRSFSYIFQKFITRKKIFGILIFVFGVIIALIINIASVNLPESVRPFLWLSWPLLIGLTILAVFLLLIQ
jgi:hypothetical protein